MKKWLTAFHMALAIALLLLALVMATALERGPRSSGLVPQISPRTHSMAK